MANLEMSQQRERECSFHDSLMPHRPLASIRGIEQMLELLSQLS